MGSAPCVLGQTAASVMKEPPAARTPVEEGSRPENSALSRQLNALIEAPAVSRDHWGVMVTGLDGSPLASINATQLFQPASNAKLYTTAAAMALLGPARTFETRVIGEGDWEGNSALKGNLRIVGDGDANLSGRPIPYIAPELRQKDAVPADPLRYLEELADAVAATGLKSVTGDVVGDDSGSLGDDSRFPWVDRYPSDWALDDLVWEFGAPVTSLVINDNQIKLTITPGAATTKGSHSSGMQPRYAVATVSLEPALHYYSLIGGVTTVPGKGPSEIHVVREPGTKELYVTGTIAADGPPDVEEIAIEDPGEFAAIAFKAMLEQRGITVTGKPASRHGVWAPQESFLSESQKALPTLALREEQDSAGAVGCSDCGHGKAFAQRVLATHVSPALADDVVVTNKVSQNLHAELLQRHLGEALGERGSAAEGARVVRAFLTTRVGIDKDDFVLFDGSGLSGHDLVTPRATAKLLAYVATQPWFAQWKASLPVGGVDGSLEARFAKPPLKGHIFAKTGTLGEARALSGYVDCASGRTVIFSIMVGNHLPGTSADRDAMDGMVAAIAAAL